MIKRCLEAAEFIKSKINFEPEICIVLGSGLGALSDEIEAATIIDYKDIPNFPVSTVEGHTGRLVCGRLCGKNIIALQGRVHYYEGYSMESVTFFIRVMCKLGIKKIILTNAAGGLRLDLTPGSLMIITDHINMTGTNPLIGKNYDEFGVRFPDMSQAYDEEYIGIAEKLGEQYGVKKGIYAGISGPTYCTKAELNMLISNGADAVGMSTVPEAIVAVHSGMRVLGISCITDCANPSRMEAPSHEEIMKIAQQTRPKFISLVKEIIHTL